MERLAYLAAALWIAGLYALANSAALAPIGRITAVLAHATGGQASTPFGLIAAVFGFLMLAALSAE